MNCIFGYCILYFFNKLRKFFGGIKSLDRIFDNFHKTLSFVLKLILPLNFAQLSS